MKTLLGQSIIPQGNVSWHGGNLYTGQICVRALHMYEWHVFVWTSITVHLKVRYVHEGNESIGNVQQYHILSASVETCLGMKISRLEVPHTAWETTGENQILLLDKENMTLSLTHEQYLLVLSPIEHEWGNQRKEWTMCFHIPNEHQVLHSGPERGQWESLKIHWPT